MNLAGMPADRKAVAAAAELELHRQSAEELATPSAAAFHSPSDSAGQRTSAAPAAPASEALHAPSPAEPAWPFPPSLSTSSESEPSISWPSSSSHLPSISHSYTSH